MRGKTRLLILPFQLPYKQGQPHLSMTAQTFMLSPTKAVGSVIWRFQSSFFKSKQSVDFIH